VNSKPAPAARVGWSRKKRAEMRWRSATRGLRTLPDFLVLSAGRCGSTSLFAILCAHPQVMAPSHKELHYFDRNSERGLDFYRRFFPTSVHRRARERRLGLPAVTGEATTYYLLHPAVPDRVQAALPRVKLVVVLRDPVDRAYSHYQLSVRNGVETLSFEDALDAEEERLAGADERLLVDPGYDRPSHRYHSYVARGLYLPQLERWHARVPWERTLVVRAEDLFEQPHATIEEITAFLALASHPGPLPAPRNRAVYEDMRPETRERLRRRFAAPNEQLEAYLGRELGWQRPT
jgi:hypothetical protein